jgi:hypothetical protein
VRATAAGIVSVTASTAHYLPDDKIVSRGEQCPRRVLRRLARTRDRTDCSRTFPLLPPRPAAIFDIFGRCILSGVMRGLARASIHFRKMDCRVNPANDRVDSTKRKML